MPGLVPATRTIALAKPTEGQPGGWLSTPQGPAQPEVFLDRVGRHVATTLGGVTGSAYGGTARGRSARVLTADQLWTVYTRVPDVRAAIDAIVRRVATWDWLVEPKLDPSDEGFFEAQKIADEARDLLLIPNADGETWQEFWTKLVTDLLIFDAGVAEVVFNGIENPDSDGPETIPGTEFEEFVVLRGADIIPVIDEFGRNLGFQQDLYGSGVVSLASPPGTLNALRGVNAEAPVFEPRQIVFFRMFPSTSTTAGQPLIEVIINEIIAMMRQSEHAMLAFDADEIPPGILVITGVSGAAADAAKQDLRRLRGKDHKVRVVTSPDPNATGARWVELRHTPKDLEFTDVILQIRRTIWRVFGVLPIEMGDTQNIPRSVGRVQLEVGASHLIAPILELIEGKVNARMLPALMDPARAKQVRFKFDREAKLTAVEQKAKSDSMALLVSNGVISRNEARRDLDLVPVAGGDTVTIDTPTGPVPLSAFVPTPEEVTEPGDENPEDGSEEIEIDPLEADDEGLSRNPDNFATRGRPEHVHGPDCMAGACTYDRFERSLVEDLPSEWQPRGMFQDVRTISLTPLWEVTAEYGRRVRDLYEAATAEVVALVGSTFVPGELDDERATRLLQRAFERLGKLEVDWAVLTRQFYREAAKIGRDAATDHTGRQVQDEYKAFADTYWARAMGFLTQPGGLTWSLRARLSALVAGLQNERAAQLAPDTRQGIEAEIPEGAVATATVAEATALTAEAFIAESHRITNWSGRLIELANLTLVEGMQEGGAGLVDDGDESGRSASWFVEWVNVGDGRMCPTCEDLGTRGFVSVGTLPTVPGGATECRANCRCVLVMWTQAEIASGKAFLLSGGAP